MIYGPYLAAIIKPVLFFSFHNVEARRQNRRDFLTLNLNTMSYTHRTKIVIPFVGDTEIELKYQVTERQMAFYQSAYWPELLDYKIITPFVSDAARLRADGWLADNQEHLNDILQEDANWENPELA